MPVAKEVRVECGRSKNYDNLHELEAFCCRSTYCIVSQPIKKESKMAAEMHVAPHIVVHFYPLLPIVIHCYPLFSIVFHCCPLIDCLQMALSNIKSKT